ncbi:MAG: hypothetical protein ACAI18_04700 [Gemmatimonadales bacterium]
MTEIRPIDRAAAHTEAALAAAGEVETLILQGHNTRAYQVARQAKQESLAALQLLAELGAVVTLPR